MSHLRSRSTTVLARGLLAVGFVVLTGAFIVAHRSPATGYETSLYTGTPVAYWVLLGFALLISLILTLGASATWFRRLALILGGGAATSFAGLPVLRGYWYFGAGDALTHLGWIAGVRSGTIETTELVYSGLHTLATMFSLVFGVELSQATLLVIVVLSCLFFVFVPLSAAVVYDSRYTTSIAAFSAFLFLPITTLSTHMVLHSMSQSILYSTVVLYLLLKYVRSNTSLFSPSATGLVLAVGSVPLVLYHPQLAAHLLVAFGAICAVQFLYRRYRSTHPIADHRPIYGQTAVLATAFLAWSWNHDFFAGVIEFTVTSAIGYLLGEGTAAESVGSQGASLSAIGASVVEVALKLFGSSFLYIFLAAVLLLWTVKENDGTLTAETHGLLPYFTVSLTGLMGLFTMYFLGSVSEMYFRVLGLMLLYVTILGAVAIAYGMTSLSWRYSSSAVHSVVTVGLGIVLLVSLIAVFPSPYIYSGSPHVTEKKFSGHETAFENQAEGVTFTGIRSGPNRYADAIDPNLSRTRTYGSISGEQIEDGISQQYAEDRYLIVTVTDREREIETFRELRYSEEQLDSIDTQTGVNRVQSNGEFRLYYVDSADDG